MEDRDFLVGLHQHHESLGNHVITRIIRTEGEQKTRMFYLQIVDAKVKPNFFAWLWGKITGKEIIDKEYPVLISNDNVVCIKSYDSPKTYMYLPEKHDLLSQDIKNHPKLGMIFKLFYEMDEIAIAQLNALEKARDNDAEVQNIMNQTQKKILETSGIKDFIHTIQDTFSQQRQLPKMEQKPPMMEMQQYG